MISHKNQRLLLVLTLFLSTVFLYGCTGGTSSSGVETSTMRFEIRDITTKAALDNVNVMIVGPDPQSANGAVSVLRQIKTDSRGKATASDLPSDRQYTVRLSKEGYQDPPNATTQPQFIPDISAGMVVEQSKSYDIVGYLIKANSAATGTIRGYVKNRVTGEAISNATVFTSPQSSVPSVIDTTDKSSKPGYYELANVPSGANTLNASIPGITTAFSSSVTVPANGTIDYDILINPGEGTLAGTLLAASSETLAPGIYIVQVLRNGTDVIASNRIEITNTTTGAMQYTVPNVPVIMTGSTSNYTVKITSDSAHMSNPAGGVSGITLRQDGQTVQVAPITMMAEKGTVLVTLYHSGTFATLENTDTLAALAAQAVITVEGGVVEMVVASIDGNNRFYKYRLSNVPVGKRAIKINFPGHSVASGSEINALKDSEVAVLFTLSEAGGN